MALVAGRLGHVALATYQIVFNLFFLFGLFGEPLNQTAQAMLPVLLESPEKQGAPARQAVRNLSVLSLIWGLVVAAASAATLGLGGTLFTQDANVLAELRKASFPVVPVCLASLILCKA